MQGRTDGTNSSEHARPGMALGHCLVEGDPETTRQARRARGKTFGVSLAIEIGLLVLLVATPVFRSVAQPKIRQLLPPQITFLGAPRLHSTSQDTAPTTTSHSPEIPNPVQPTLILDGALRAVHDEEIGEIPIPDLPVGSGLETIQSVDIGTTALFVKPPQIVQPAQQEKRPVKVSEGVLEAQLISRIEPQYPIIAIQTKTEGTVRLHAFISHDGRIISLDVLSGHPFLVKAALEAVRQWRYRPTMLNGEPVEVETSITVIFRLHG